MLAGGDLRTLGRSAEVAAKVLAQPSLLSELVRCFESDQELIVARAADALEKIAAQEPRLLQPHKRLVLERLANMEHWVVREHVCQLLPLLTNLSAAERRQALTTVEAYLDDQSSVVKAFALECLVRLSKAPGFENDARRVQQIVDRCVEHGASAALRARARKLVRQRTGDSKN